MLNRGLEEKHQADESSGNELTAELEKKKAELDAQILESRKQVLDERRKLAQTEKELLVMQDKYSALNEEFTEFKKQAAAKIDKAKHSGGTIDPAQLAEISAKANADANAVVADAQKKAEEIITAAKAYFADTVQKTYDYKQSVLEKANTFASTVTSGGTSVPAVDISTVLATVSSALNEAIANAQSAIAAAMDEAGNKASDEVNALNDAVSKAVEEAKNAEVPIAEAENAQEEKLSDDEELNSARAELENIGGFDASELEAYIPMSVEPYSFELKLDMPKQANDSDDIDDLLADNNGLLSSFEIVSGDDDISADNVDTGDLLVEETPAVTNDVAELLTEEPGAATAPNSDRGPSPDDFRDLLAEEPAPAPAPKVKEEPAPAADDFSDLLADAPAQSERIANRGSNKPKEKLNESRSMGVAGKEEKVNDPWKDLEAQMNGMTITPPPVRKETADDDGMTSSFDDPAASAAPAKEEKIDMSDYSSMLGGINDNMTSNTAQYDPSWDLKMMEGLNGDDDDDEMSSDNVGFFDL